MAVSDLGSIPEPLTVTLRWNSLRAATDATWPKLHSVRNVSLMRACGLREFLMGGWGAGGQTEKAFWVLCPVPEGELHRSCRFPREMRRNS